MQLRHYILYFPDINIFADHPLSPYQQMTSKGGNFFEDFTAGNSQVAESKISYS
jgi:hypothetical protein